MKAILFAAGAGLLLLTLATMCLRQSRSPNRARMLVILYLAVLGLLILAHEITPFDLGFLGKDAVVSNSNLDLLFAIALYTAGFFGGILQLYNLADRGLSLRMLIDILEDSSGEISVERMMTAYGGGQGILWMYDKRIRDMISSGLVQETRGNIILTKRGLTLARIYSVLRALAHVNVEP